MQENCVNSLEVVEVVYLPEVKRSTDSIRVPPWLINTLVVIFSGIAIGLVTWYFTSHLPGVIDSSIEKSSRPFDIRLTKIETFLKITSKDAAAVISQIPNLLKDAGNNQIKLQAALELTAETAQQARQESDGKQQQVSPEQLSNAGTSAISVLPKLTQPQPALDAIAALVSYRSFENAPFAPSLENSYPITGAKGSWKFDFSTRQWEHPAGGQISLLAIPPHLPASDAARAESLARSNFNQGNETGASFVFFVVTKPPVFLHLDEWFLKHAVIRGATVVYNGGPARLAGVFFC